MLFRVARFPAPRRIRLLGMLAAFIAAILIAPPGLAQLPDSTLAGRFQLAETYLQAGQFDRAIAVLEDLYDAQPSAYVFYDRLLEAYVSTERYDDALALVDMRVGQEAGNPVFIAEKARVLYLKGDEAEAFATWDAALAAQPENRNTYRLVYQSLIEVRQTERAIEVLERGREALGEEANFQTDLAYLYSLSGRHGDAFDEYLSLLQQNGRQFTFIRSRLGRFMEDSTVVSTGIERTERAVRREPLNRGFRELLAWLYLESGDYARALDANRAIDRLEEESGRVLFLFAQQAADAGAYDAASAAFAEISERYPDAPAAPEALMGMAVMHEMWARKTHEKAVDAGGNPIEAPHFQAALAGYQAFTEKYPVHPYYPEALRRIADLQRNTYQALEDAEATYQEIIRRYPVTESASTAELELGRIAVLRGDLDQARIAFSRLIDRLGTGDLVDQARYELALVHFYRGEFEAAQTLADVLNRNTSALVANDAIELKVLLLENRGPDSLSTPLRDYAEAHLLERQRKSAEAVARLEALLARYPDHALADESRFLRAEALRTAGRSEEAAAAFAEIPLLHPVSFLADRSLFMAAEVLEHDLADTSGASALYTKLLTEYPGSLHAADARERIRALRGDGV